MFDIAIIATDGTVTRATVKDEYPAINEALGVEWIESLRAGQNIFFFDEEGKFNGHGANPVAQALLISRGVRLMPGDRPVGPVAVSAGPEGIDALVIEIESLNGR